MADRHGERDELPGILKEIFGNIRTRFGPDLESVLEDFYRNNNLPEPERVAKTSRGIIATGEDYLFVLDSELLDDGSELRPFLGGDGSMMYSRMMKRYVLKGEIKGKEVRLVADIIEKHTYSRKEREGFCNCCSPYYAKEGGTDREISRKDDYPLWFMTEAGKGQS